MVGGVIVIAVAIELTISHPTEALSTADVVVFLGGPAIFLAGNALFKHAVGSGTPAPPVAGIVALALLIPVALIGERLVLGAVVTLVPVALAVMVLRPAGTGRRPAGVTEPADRPEVPTDY
jgi:low temperature requirement protein LtrA